MSGSNANTAGKQFENKIEHFLTSKGYYVIQNKDKSKYTFANNVVIANYPIVAKDNKSGLGRVEFYDSVNKRIIECKYQDVSGTAIEKVANTIWRLSYQPEQSIIVYGGPIFTEEKIKDFNVQILSGCQFHKKQTNHIKLMSEQEFYNYY